MRSLLSEGFLSASSGVKDAAALSSWKWKLGKALSGAALLGEGRSSGTANLASPSEQLQALLALKTWLWCLLVVLLPRLRTAV